MTLKDINFFQTPEFEKEIRKIKKKRYCYTILKDIEILKKALRVNVPEHQSTVRISNLGDSIKIPIYKVKNFRCKSINKGSRSGFRIIYAFIEDSSSIIFLEIYHKNKKETENRDRIYKYFTAE